MLKKTALEPWHINSAVNRKEPIGIFQRTEKIGQGGGERGEPTDGKEDRHFLLMLKAGLAAFHVKEAKAAAVGGLHDILKNIVKGSDIEKGENLAKKQAINHGDQVSEEKNEERQAGFTEIPIELQNTNYPKSDHNVVRDRSVDVPEKDSGENNAVGLQHLRKGAGIQSGVLERENGTPFFSDEKQLKDTDGIVSSALREKGIDEKDISKILAAIKEGGLKLVPMEGPMGEIAIEKDSGERVLRGTLSDSETGKVALPESLLAALREKGIDVNDISKILTIIKEVELKSVSLEQQIGEAVVESDSGLGVLKGMSSDFDAEKGDCSDDSPSFPGKGKVTVSEPFALTEHAADLTAYGGDSKVIKSGDAKPLDGRLLVNQIASQLHPEADKGFSRVKIALFPENLGGLDMDIIIRENKIHVVLTADRQDVRQVLQGHADQLRNALQNQGLQVEYIDFLLRDSPWEMDGGSGGSYFSWREDNGNSKGGEREYDVPASSAMLLSVVRQTSGTEEGGISLFV